MIHPDDNETPLPRIRLTLWIAGLLLLVGLVCPRLIGFAFEQPNHPAGRIVAHAHVVGMRVGPVDSGHRLPSPDGGLDDDAAKLDAAVDMLPPAF